MLTSARPRTLVLVVSDLVIDVAMLGPRGQELGPRQVVPLSTETATLWAAIDQLGEFDRITLVGLDRGGLCSRVARESQRPMRQISHGALHWSRVISAEGVELAITLGPRFASTLYYAGVELPGFDLGRQRIKKDRRLREYVAQRVFERRGAETWQRRVTRAVDEVLSVWNPAALYIATPPSLPMPELPSQVVLVPACDSLEEALGVWGANDAHGRGPGGEPTTMRRDTLA